MGEAISESFLQLQTDEQWRAMVEARGFVPRRLGLLDVWLRVLGAVVRVLTFGRWRVVRGPLRGPVRWDGNLK